MSEPTISVILPCFNEEGFIANSVRSLLSQETSGQRLEVIVADGMSTDGTREELATITDSRLIVVDNPDKTVPYAMQRGLERARGEYIFRADAHAEYPNDYLIRLLPHLRDDSLRAVGGVIRTVPSGSGKTPQAIAIALNSRFGVGSSFRTFSGTELREAETVPFGGWRRETVDAVGGFDTAFTRAQDLEFNVRLRKMGGSIICDPDVIIKYYSRPTYRKLAGMSYQYGYWKVLVNAKHKLLSSARQLFPAALVLTILLGLLASPFLGPFWWAGLLPLAGYLAGAGLISLRSSSRHRKLRLAPRVTIAFVTAHLVYGFGYLRALFNTYVLRKHRWTEVSRVTR